MIASRLNPIKPNVFCEIKPGKVLFVKPIIASLHKEANNCLFRQVRSKSIFISVSYVESCKGPGEMSGDTFLAFLRLIR
jgi:hypothetical protein